MGMLKALVGLLVLVAVVVALFQVAPPMMANYSFEDDLKTVALMDGSNFSKSDDDIRGDVLKKAREHELPIQEKQVIVQRINTPGVAAVYVGADYSVPINLPGYSFDMHFTPNSGNKGF
jgi:hypothetical protein